MLARAGKDFPSFFLIEKLFLRVIKDRINHSLLLCFIVGNFLIWWFCYRNFFSLVFREGEDADYSLKSANNGEIIRSPRGFHSFWLRAKILQQSYKKKLSKLFKSDDEEMNFEKDVQICHNTKSHTSIAKSS